MNAIVERLIEHGQQLFNQPAGFVALSGIDAIDRPLNDLKNAPHLFVLGCIMNQQTRIEKAWTIPVAVMNELGTNDFKAFQQLSLEWLITFFHTHKLHRFNSRMATFFHAAVQQIEEKYQGNASRIWADNPRSAQVVERFLNFQGVGIKIATMTTNILVRDFKISLSDRSAIDISPDTHARRVFYRLGLTSTDQDNDLLMSAARKHNPDYPGIFDFPAFEIGYTWCKPQSPLCHTCYMGDICPKTDVKPR